MSTISKINVGSKDYDIIDSGLRGIGTKIDSSTNLSNLTTPDTRFHFSGIGTAPTNSPTNLAYTLDVKSAPSDTEGEVIQTARALGTTYERKLSWNSATSGGSFVWGSWVSPSSAQSSIDSQGDASIKQDGSLTWKKSGKLVFVNLIKSVTSSGYIELGTLPYEARPDGPMDTYGVVSSNGDISGLCLFAIQLDGTTSVSMVPSGGGNINAYAVYLTSH